MDSRPQFLSATSPVVDEGIRADDAKGSAEAREDIEICALEAEMARLRDRVHVLVQRRVARYAVAQVGELIEWSYGRTGKRRGRILSMREWVGAGSVEYRVVVIRQDGSDGAKAWVRPYDNARKVEL